MSRAGDIRAIHACARAAGLDEDARRDVYARVAGLETLTGASDAAIRKIAAEMRRLAPARKRRSASAKPHVRMIYKLWWLLADAKAVARNMDRKRALNAFITSDKWAAKWGDLPTDVEFLTPERGKDVIEALKEIARRENVDLKRRGP